MKLTCQNFSVARRLRRGFSLIEMMVAVSLMLVIVIGLFAMFGQAQRALKMATTQVDVMEPGRATMDFTARDLQELSPARLTNVVNFHVINPATAPLKQPLPGSAVRMNELNEFFLLSRYNDRWTGIGYRVDAIMNEGVGTLYRFATNAPYAGVSRLATNFMTAAIHRTDGTINPQFHRVLDGVVHLKVFPFRSNGQFYLPRDEDVIDDPFGIRIKISENASSFTFLGDRMPAYVEVELGVLEPAVYEQFKVQPPALKRKFLESKASQVHLFRQRIPIRTVQ